MQLKFGTLKVEHFDFDLKLKKKKDLNDFENVSRHAWNCEFLLSLFNFYSKKNKFFKPVAADMYASCKHDNWIWREMAPKCRQNRNNLNEKKPRLLTDRRSDTDMSWFHRLHSLLLLYSVCWGHHWIKSSSFSVWFGLVLVNFFQNVNNKVIINVNVFSVFTETVRFDSLPSIGHFRAMQQLSHNLRSF